MILENSKTEIQIEENLIKRFSDNYQKQISHLQEQLEKSNNSLSKLSKKSKTRSTTRISSTV